VWWDADAGTIVETPAELDAVLDAVAALDGPALVQFYDADEPKRVKFTVGLSGDRGVLRYAGLDDMGGSTSRATKQRFAAPERGVLYYCMSADTEFPDDAEIPAADVREAAQEFLRIGGTRPTGVAWRDA
jgi:immunity protein Imm1 of predicted polymorphic toxin system